MKLLGRLLCALALGLAVGACTVHKIDVQQGNVITQETLAKLSVGMERKQVVRLLGTPLIEDPFHQGRWDYLYRFVVGDTGEEQTGHVVLTFQDDKLAAIDVRRQPPPEAEIKTPSLIRK
jgi:outer membrane protein assembly factor BamE (lipoprotein component of BamABCDE complex)